MRRYGAKLMKRSKQWWQAVGSGSNGVGGFSGGFRRKLTEVWWLGEERSGGLILKKTNFGNRIGRF